MKLTLVAGCRPNFVKIAPLIWEIRRHPEISLTLVHTGQHYDHLMSQVFFDQLGIPAPNHNLGVGSLPPGEQIGTIMARLEPVLKTDRPDFLVVVGDVNSTAAAALTGAKMNIPVAHVEAGLRLGDKSVPEEVNRIVTDAVSSVLFTSDEGATENLRHEGKLSQEIHNVGNVMADTLLHFLPHTVHSDALYEHGVLGQQYAILTFHRQENMNRNTILSVLRTSAQLACPVLFVEHPRFREALSGDELFGQCIQLINPLPYTDMLALLEKATLVLTDSGGIQEETTILGVPCLTLRERTERPITVMQGTNQVVGTDPDRIFSVAKEILDGKVKKGSRPELWDGHTSERIIRVLLHLHNGRLVV